MAATAAAIGGQVALGTVSALGSRPAAAVSRADGFSMRRSALGGLGSPLRLQTSRVATESKRFPLVSAKTKTEVEVEEVKTEVSDAANDLLKSVQETWEKTDDKLAISSLGFAAFVTLWGSFGLIGAIDKLPILPGLFELVGILVTGWFTYRYLIFKPDREELLKKIDETKSKITGQ
ncbi:hypothetical protein Mapa_011951 [Marchantia paleacea]|nr:hypothetical protein Mapa_011951 [Marchantia paleacea]